VRKTLPLISGLCEATERARKKLNLSQETWIFQRAGLSGARRLGPSGRRGGSKLNVNPRDPQAFLPSICTFDLWTSLWYNLRDLLSELYTLPSKVCYRPAGSERQSEWMGNHSAATSDMDMEKVTSLEVTTTTFIFLIPL